MRTKLSIIVPAYNVSLFIKKCISSLLNQNFSDYKIYIFDDGSTDDTGVICDSFSNDEKITVIHNNNIGCSLSRNEGILLADSKYIMFVDGDDWIEKNTLKELIEKMEKEGIDYLRFNYYKEATSQAKNLNVFLKERIYEGKNDTDNLISNLIGLKEKELKYLEKFNFMSSCCTCIYNRDFLVKNNIKFKDYKEIGLFVDGLFNLDVLLNRPVFCFVDKYIYHYRKYNGSATKKIKQNLLEKEIKVVDLIKEKLGPLASNYSLELSNRLCFSCVEVFLNICRDEEKSKTAKINEIKKVLKNEKIKGAIKQFKLKYLNIKWGMYYLFAKIKFGYGLYLLTTYINRRMDSKK